MTVKQAINEAIKNGWDMEKIEVRHANGKKATKKENTDYEKVIKIGVFGGCGFGGVYRFTSQAKKVIFID